MMGMETVTIPIIGGGAGGLERLFPERGWKLQKYHDFHRFQSLVWKGFPREGMETREIIPYCQLLKLCLERLSPKGDENELIHPSFPAVLFSPEIASKPIKIKLQ
jgi:hypothetical protein